MADQPGGPGSQGPWYGDGYQDQTPTAAVPPVPPQAPPGTPAPQAPQSPPPAPPAPPTPPAPPRYPPPSYPGGAPGQPSGSSTPGWSWALIGGLAVLIVVGLVVIVLLMTRSSDSAKNGPSDSVDSTTTVIESSSTETSVPPSSDTTVPPSSATTAPPTSGPLGDVRALPAGLLCKDLKSKGYSYSAAVDYWRVHGQPNQMDADRNGIPCETVYPRSDVIAYWPEASYRDVPVYALPSGLLCKDLAARGIDVYGALLYYIWEEYPSRMDADGNGIPCETVYPNAREVWLYEF